MVLSAHPLLVRHLLGLVLQAEDLGRLRSLRTFASAQRIYIWNAAVDLLVNERLHILAGCLWIHHFSVVSLIGSIHIVVHAVLLTVGRLASVTINREGQSLQQLLILLE